jgi:hypothetical protein
MDMQGFYLILESPVVGASLSLQMSNWQTNRGGRARGRREGINDSDVELG